MCSAKAQLCTSRSLISSLGRRRNDRLLFYDIENRYERGRMAASRSSTTSTNIVRRRQSECLASPSAHASSTRVVSLSLNFLSPPQEMARKSKELGLGFCTCDDADEHTYYMNPRRTNNPRRHPIHFSSSRQMACTGTVLASRLVSRQRQIEHNPLSLPLST